MSKIDLQNSKIKFEGEWLSSDELSNMIQGKIESGDMKFSDLASALEKLNVALENAHQLETKILLLQEDYEKLKMLGDDDDSACVRKAVMAYIGGDTQTELDDAPDSESEGKKKKRVRSQNHFLG
jgi:hypothetical protein